jgi:hypothetical protein
MVFLDYQSGTSVADIQFNGGQAVFVMSTEMSSHRPSAMDRHFPKK